MKTKIKNLINKKLKEESEPKIIKSRTPLSIKEGEEMWELVDESGDVVAYIPDYDFARTMQLTWNKDFDQ